MWPEHFQIFFHWENMWKPNDWGIFIHAWKKWKKKKKEAEFFLLIIFQEYKKCPGVGNFLSQTRYLIFLFFFFVWKTETIFP